MIKAMQVGSNFYWRSRDKYEGAKTLTGPATSGFESIDQLPEVKLSAKYRTRTEKWKLLYRCGTEKCFAEYCFFHTNTVFGRRQ